MGNGPENWIPALINAVAFIFSGLAAVVTITWKFSEYEKKIQDEINTKIEVSGKEQDKKTARVYERFDEYKNFIESQFVRKEMCGVMHSNTASAINLQNARLDSLEKKMDELKDILVTYVSLRKE